MLKRLRMSGSRELSVERLQAENLELRALAVELRAENSELRHANAECQHRIDARELTWQLVNHCGSNPLGGLAVPTTMRLPPCGHVACECSHLIIILPHAPPTLSTLRRGRLAPATLLPRPRPQG